MIKNDEFIEIAPIKVNINDIFNKKTKLGSLIQFDLLLKIIEEFIERQNKANDKMNELEIKMNKLYNLENKTLENAFNDLNRNNIINENELIKDIIDKNEKNEKETIDKDTILDINEIKNKKISDEINENINNESSKDINITYKEKNINQDILNEKIKNDLNKNEKLKFLYSKINKLEIKFNELSESFSFLNNNSQKRFQSINEKDNSYETKFSNQDKKIKELEEKINDYNIYDIFKDDDKDLESDKTNMLIRRIKEKLLREIEFSDIRNNENEESIVKLKNEIDEIKNANENMEKLIKNIKNNYNNLLNGIESKLNDFKLISDEISRLKEIIDNSVSKEELLIYINELNENMNKISKKSENISKIYEDLSEKLNGINKDLESYVNKKLEDSKNFVKNYVTNLNIDIMEKEISQIKKELNKKLNKENLGSINLKIETIENIQDTYKAQMDDYKNDLFSCNDKCLKTIRMIESLRTQILNLKKEEKRESNKNEEEKNIEKYLSLYITKEIFDEEINIILKKIEKISNFENDNYRNILSLEEHMKHLVSENDLRNIEQYLINLIDEYKMKDTKKFVDKSEYQKSYKYLEVQINHLNDITSKDNENWLIAKKPINNYMCASCESYIGDLKNKEEFSPWNRIPSREENKRYRIGHGFSKILKLVNKDLIKKVQRVNSGINIGIKWNENKKISKKKLPKINIPNQINNEEESIEKINNSADNIENNNLNEHIISDNRENTERVINKISIINNMDINLKNIENNDDERPKVIKIYKKLKNNSKY